jgi:ankyrin repeat protein
MLLLAGSPVSDSARSGDTPLHFAASAGMDAIINRLLAAGANANAKGEGGYVPAYCAAFEGHLQSTILLLDAGTDALALSKSGETLLHAVARGGLVDLARRLVETEGIDPGTADKIGSTPLHFAAEGSQPEMVRFLLEAGAPKASKNKRGKTPRNCIRGEKGAELAKLLK